MLSRLMIIIYIHHVYVCVCYLHSSCLCLCLLFTFIMFVFIFVVYTGREVTAQASHYSDSKGDDFPRRTRTHFTPTQLASMEEKFMENQYPDLKAREEIAKQLKLQEMQVQVCVMRVVYGSLCVCVCVSLFFFFFFVCVCVCMCVCVCVCVCVFMFLCVCASRSVYEWYMTSCFYV